MTPERFPDKQVPEIDFGTAVAHIQAQQEYGAKVEVAQDEATWRAYGEYPKVPIGITYFTDVHFGSKGTDYDLLEEHLQIVENTPNMFMLMGGDIIDAFAATKHPTGMMGDALSPGEQVEAMMDMLSRMDQKGKLGGVQTGNHDNWSDVAGYDFERFLRELECPVFSGAGNINIMVGDGAELYRVYWAHTHFGRSRINITNASKRALQFSSPHADIALLGHTHQSSVEHFDIGGEQRIAIVGGTYKQQDKHAQKWGMSTPGAPGHTIILWPDQHRFETFRDPHVASDFLLNTIKSNPDQNDPYTELLAQLKSREALAEHPDTPPEQSP